jgi:hypothetical protein
VVIVWGGTKDISRNESTKGLSQIRSSVRINKNTNIMVMNLPNRQDIDATSCINQEMKVFNRKLGKYMKSFDHASSVEVKFDREQYTRHGLHLNKNEKELATNRLVTVIKGTFVKNKRIPVSAIWKEGQGVKIYNSIDKEKDSTQKVMDLLKQSDEKSTGLVNLEEQKMEDTMKCGNKVGSNWQEDEQVKSQVKSCR